MLDFENNYWKNRAYNLADYHPQNGYTPYYYPANFGTWIFNKLIRLFGIHFKFYIVDCYSDHKIFYGSTYHLHLGDH